MLEKILYTLTTWQVSILIFLGVCLPCHFPIPYVGLVSIVSTKDWSGNGAQSRNNMIVMGIDVLLNHSASAHFRAYSGEARWKKYIHLSKWRYYTFIFNEIKPSHTKLPRQWCIQIVEKCRHWNKSNPYLKPTCIIGRFLHIWVSLPWRLSDNSNICFVRSL